MKQTYTRFQIPTSDELKTKAKICALQCGLTLEQFINNAVEAACSITDKPAKK